MTADRATLLKLAADVEAAEGPDRELDVRVHAALKLGHAMEDIPGWPWPAIDRWAALPYTASVDAALALMRGKLPGWSYHLQQSFSGRVAARLYDPDEDYDEELPLPSFPARGDAPTLTRAIVAAVLRAVAGEGDG